MNEAADEASAGAGQGAARTRGRVLADLVLMLCGSIFSGLLTIAIAPILPQLTAHYADRPDAALLAQIVMVAPCIGVIVGGLIAGTLIDRHGLRLVLAASSFAYVLLGGIGLLIDDAMLLIGSRFLLGIAGSGIYAATFALIGEHHQGRSRARILGYRGAAGAGGATLAVLGAGIIAQHWGWQSVFLLYFLALPIGLLAIGMPAGRPARLAAEGVAPSGALLRMAPIFLLLVLMFAATFTTHAQGGFLLVANRIVRPDVQSAVLAAASFPYMLTSALYGPVSARIGALGAFRIGLAVNACGAILAGLGGGLVPIAIGFVLFGLGNGLSTPFLHQLVLDRAPEGARGRAAGLVSPAHYAGEFLNPFVFHLLLLFVGIQGGFVLVGVLLALAALALWPGRGRVPAGPIRAASPDLRKDFA